MNSAASSTTDVIRRVIAEHLGRPIEEVQDECVLETDLGADSLDTIEIMMEAEDELSWSVSFDDPMPSTVGELITRIEAGVRPGA